ncbi:hypothetical protein [Bartonella sp. F02]|uniref:hypothetical protein n=1 Tax=Bartonella sp. F02 TaxID=2967262 RepID=UPI0022A9D36D|nr:hypothetical protein [Bartonella sp. F02]MCZ2328746.1 hypothetical protein [Bartonella sp. F02]
MNIKSHSANAVAHDKLSSFVVDQKQKTETFTEITMSNIATQLRYVYEQMQAKQAAHHATIQNILDNHFKSYLDDINQAILAEHAARIQTEKKLFDHLKQIEMLIQNLLHEKKDQKEAAMISRASHSQSVGSVVHYLAHATGEKEQNFFSSQDVPIFLKKEKDNALQSSSMNSLQHNKVHAPLTESVSSLSKDIAQSLKDIPAEKKFFNAHLFRDIAVQRIFSVKKRSLKFFLFLSYCVKKTLVSFLLIALMIVITLCFYRFIEWERFF